MSDGALDIVIAVHQLPPEVGGVGTFTVNLAAELQRRGHRVTLLAGSEEPAPYPSLNLAPPVTPGVPTYRLQRTQPRSAAGRFLSSFIDRRAEALCRGLLRQLAPDVLHVQHTLNLTSGLCGLGRAAGAAVVASVHDFWPICQRIDLRDAAGELCRGPQGGLRCAACLAPTKSGLLARARRRAAAGARLAPYLLRTQLVQGGYASAHRITCPSLATAEVLQRCGFDAARMVLVDYGIPALPGGVAAQPRPRRPFRFGFLGTMGPHKGARLTLRAAELLEAGPSSSQALARPWQKPGPSEPGPGGGPGEQGTWQLRLHGGPLRDPLLRRQLEAAAATGRAEYLGPYTQEELPGVLAELDALIIPSLWPETGPMVLMEAVAAGLPVIGARIGAIAARIHHGEDGLLVPPGDVGDLAEAMATVMDDYDHLRGGALQRPVRSVADAAAELEVVYREALASR